MARNMKKKPRPECIVPGSLALLLRVSRLAGVAPVQLVKEQNGWLVRLSPALYFYSYLLIIVINLLTILAVISDLLVPLEWTVRMRTETRCVVWITDVIVVSLTANVGVYTAPAQMMRFIGYVNKIQKINAELMIRNLPLPRDTVQFRMVTGSLFGIIFIMGADFLDVMHTAAVENRHLPIAAVYSCYYISYIMLQLLEIQFIAIVSYVLASLKLINLGLKTILHERTLDTTVALNETSESRRVYAQNVIIPTKYVNKIIDSVAVVRKAYSENIETTSRPTGQEVLRNLSLSYGSICEIIREVDQNYGTILLLLLASFLLHLVVTPYYMITTLFDHSSQTFWNKFGKPTLQLLWCLFHTIDLVMLIEPCQRTLDEMDVTKQLVCHLMWTSIYDPMTIELKLFCKRFSLNQVSYAPLKVCTLTRSLVATIFGNITTYLVVIIQF